jgi:hypothetical protein
MATLTRRQLMLATAASGGLALLSRPAIGKAYTLPAPTRQALAESPLVYISPLKSGGEESRCHGEVWFYVDRGDVIVGSEVSTWKVRAVQGGLNKARLWVADHGPQWRALNRYRSAPNFLARVEVDSSESTYEGLMESYAQRYRDEWGAWEERFRKQYKDGTRVLLRYSPAGD